jgi:hypothetical protein
MTIRRRVLAAVAVVVAALVPTSAATFAGASAAGHNANDDLAYVDRMLFETSIKDFRRAQHDGDRWFDWSTDGCSAPLVGNTGRSFDFTASCARHDFGYRNLRQLEDRYGVDDWNSTSRKQVDQQFLEDMRAHCHGRSFLLRPTCYAWAQTFYTAVRLAGG